MTSTELYPTSVLVIAASGYIGFGVAKAFRKAGYVVYGSIRKETYAAHLRAHEIIPIIGDATRPEEFKKHLEAASIIVDCSITFSADHPEAVPLKILETTELASQIRDKLLPPKTFIYTSGIMVYEHDTRMRDESWPIGKTVYATWRRKVEERVITSPHINGIVIRPGWVFGGSGGTNAENFFNPPEKLVLHGKHHDRRYSWIHIDDLADAYVAAANKAQVAKGLIFNIVNGYDNAEYRELIKKGAQLAGHKGEIHWLENKGWTDELVDATVVLNSLQATTLLGWTPKLFGFLDFMELYYEAYTNAKKLQII